MALSQQIVFKRFSGGVAAGGTRDFDVSAFADFSAARYTIKIGSETEDKWKALEMLSSKKNGDITDQVYSKSGDPLGVNVNFLLIGSDTLLRFVNNESFDVNVTVLKLLI